MTIDDECLSPRNNNLTLVRLILASAVIWTHSVWRVSGTSGVDHFSPWLGDPVSVFAVDGFFFLSGFLVYASLVRRGRVSEFALARFARLWPALAVAVLLTIAIGTFFTTAPGLSYLTGETAKFGAYNLSLVLPAFYLTDVHCGNELCNINGSLWTIPWEVRCYALLAILAALGLSKPAAMKRLILPATLIVAVALHLPGAEGFIRAHLGGGIAYASGLGDRLWTAFALGIACYVWRDRIPLGWWHTLVLLAAVLGTAAYGVKVPHLGQLLIASAVVNLGFLAARRKAISADWPDYSYGMYVYAFPVMMLVAGALPGIPAEGLAFATAVLTAIPAALSWHFVEKPVLDLVRKRRKQAGSNRNGGAVRVGLLWHSPNSGNLGVGALTVAHMAIIDDAARRAGVDVHYTILGFVDPGMPTYVGHPRLTILPLRTRALLPGGGYGAAVRKLDLVLDIGAGDSFAEIYGPKRFAFMLLTKWLARFAGTPLVLAPQTIGPFERQPYRMLATRIMEAADMVVARDPQSYDVTQEMSRKIRLMQAVDVAFALPYDASKPASPGPLRVGINPSGLLFNRGYSGENEFGMDLDYADYCRKLIARLLADSGVEVWLLSHVNSRLPMDDDGSAIAVLLREFPAVRVAPTFKSPSDAKSFIAGLDFLVAGRMHACIAAYSAGVPVVPVAYSRKFSGLFSALLDYRHIVPVKGMETDAAIDFTLNCLIEREALRADIARGDAIVAAMMGQYGQFLAELLGALGHPAGQERAVAPSSGLSYAADRT